jgi:hypothetical protein
VERLFLLGHEIVAIRLTPLTLELVRGSILRT